MSELSTTEARLGQLRLGALSDDAPPDPPASGYTGQLGTTRSRLGGIALGVVSGDVPPPGPGDDEVAIRSGVEVGTRINVVVEVPVRIRSGIEVGSRAAATAESDDDELTARSGVEVGTRIAVQVDRQATPRSGIEVGSRINVVVTSGDEDTLAVRSGIEIGTRINVVVEVPVRIRSGVEVGSRSAIQHWRNVAIRSGIEVGARDAYTGPGTGIVVQGERFSPNELREGDSFAVYLPWAGLQGMSGLAQVRSRTMRDDRDEQEITLDVTPQPDPRLVPRMAGGGRPGIQPVRSDVVRRLSRQERTTDRIERERQ